MLKPITLYCSELAALVGSNRFVKQTDAWDKVFQRNFHFQETSQQKESNLGEIIGKIALEKEKEKEKEIEKETGIGIGIGIEKKTVVERENVVKEYTTRLVEKVQEALAETPEHEKERALETVLEKSFPELQSNSAILKENISSFSSSSSSSSSISLIKDSASSFVKTSYGHESESKGIDKFAEIFTGSVINTSLRPRVTSLNSDFKLYGQIDGMMDGETVIEHKARTRRLFYTNASTEIYNYEYIQMQAYMLLFKKENAYMVETIGNEINYRMVHYDQDFIDREILAKLKFKPSISLDTIRDYYFEKNPRIKSLKLQNLF